MFSELHDFNRSIGFNARAVARKQRQVLQKLKKFVHLFIYLFSFQNEFQHATKVSEVGSFSSTSVLRIALFEISLCFYTRVVARKQRQVLANLENFSFSKNESYHANGFSEVLIFKCSSVLLIA